MFEINIKLTASQYILQYCSVCISKCAVRKIALAAEIAEEKLPYSVCLVQSGGLFNGKTLATCNHFQRECIPHHIAKMKMPAVA